MPAEQVDNADDDAFGCDITVEHHAIALGDAPNHIQKVEDVKRRQADDSEPIKSLPMQNVSKQSIRCGAPLSTPVMCRCSACLPASIFKEVMSLQPVTNHRKKFGPFTTSEAAYGVLSLGSTFLVGES